MAASLLSAGKSLQDGQRLIAEAPKRHPDLLVLSRNQFQRFAYATTFEGLILQDSSIAISTPSPHTVHGLADDPRAREPRNS